MSAQGSGSKEGMFINLYVEYMYMYCRWLVVAL